MHGCCRVARVTLLLTQAGLLLLLVRRLLLLLLATSRRLLLKLQAVVRLLLLQDAGSSGRWPLLLNQAAAGTCRCLLCLLQLLLLLRHGRRAAHIGPNSSSYVLLLALKLQGTPCSRSRRRCLASSTLQTASSRRIAVGLLVLPAAWLLLLQHVLLCCSVCTL